MALHNIKIPLYNCSGEDAMHEMTVDEFAGRMDITIRTKGDITVSVSCYFEDLERAYKAIKRF